MADLPDRWPRILLAVGIGMAVAAGLLLLAAMIFLVATKRLT